MTIESPRIVAGPTVQRRYALSQPITVDDGLTAPQYEGQVYFSYNLITTTGGVSRFYEMYVAVNSSNGSITDGGNFTTNDSLGGSATIDSGDFTTGSSSGSDDTVDAGDFVTGASSGGGIALEWIKVDVNTYQDRYTGEAIDPMTFGSNTIGVG